MKINFAVAAVLLAASPAIAQTAATPDPVKLEVSRANLGLIAAGIMKLPYEQAQPLLADLQKQLDAQDLQKHIDANTPKGAGAQ